MDLNNNTKHKIDEIESIMTVNYYCESQNFLGGGGEINKTICGNLKKNQGRVFVENTFFGRVRYKMNEAHVIHFLLLLDNDVKRPEVPLLARLNGDNSIIIFLHSQTQLYEYSLERKKKKRKRLKAKRRVDVTFPPFLLNS